MGHGVRDGGEHALRLVTHVIPDHDGAFHVHGGNDVLVRPKTLRQRKRLPGAFRFVLGDAEREPPRLGEGAHRGDAWYSAAYVEEQKPDGAANRRVCAIPRTETAEPAVYADFPGVRAVHDQKRGRAGERSLHTAYTLNFSSRMASTAPMRTGIYSGLHPAMTA